MEDAFIYYISLILVLLALYHGWFALLEYDPTNYFIAKDNDETSIEGVIMNTHYNNETGFSYLQVYACDYVDVFYNNQIQHEVGDHVKIEGNVFENKITAQTIT